MEKRGPHHRAEETLRCTVASGRRAEPKRVVTPVSVVPAHGSQLAVVHAEAPPMKFDGLTCRARANIAAAEEWPDSPVYGRERSAGRAKARGDARLCCSRTWVATRSCTSGPPGLVRPIRSGPIAKHFGHVWWRVVPYSSTTGFFVERFGAAHHRSGGPDTRRILWDPGMVQRSGTRMHRHVPPHPEPINATGQVPVLSLAVPTTSLPGSAPVRSSPEVISDQLGFAAAVSPSL